MIGGMTSTDLLTFVLTWAAHAPPWVQSLLGVGLALYAGATTLNAVLWAVPESWYVFIEQRWPRAGHVLRGARKFGSDLRGVKNAVVDTWKGTPFPAQPVGAPATTARAPSVPPPAGALVLLVALVLGTATPACAGTPYQQAVRVANIAADLTDSGGDLALQRFCAASMSAIHREGTLVGGRCVESGANAGRVATPEELQELARVRHEWQPVQDSLEATVQTHGIVTHLLEAGDAATMGDLLAALGHLAEAYASLQRAALAVSRSFTLPSLGGAR